MNRKRTGAAVTALLLSLWLAGCGGAQEAAPPAAPAVVETPAATATKPPPVVAVNPPAVIVNPSGAGDTAGATAGEPGAPPAMPTAVPTVAPTEAPPTAEPTATTPPTAVPVVVQPVAPPPAAPPTAVPPTAVPPTAVPPTAAPVGVNGLIATHFALQSRADLVTNGDIWFEFNVANSTGGDVAFDALGVMPKKDGVDRPQWYQHSWGGNNDVIPSGGLSWDDHINLPEAGNYTLRLVVCFDGAACQAQKGTWHTLSAEIPITVAQR